MKILCSGYHNPSFFTITEYIERAVERSGCRLAKFDDRTFLFPGRFSQKFPFVKKIELSRINRKLLERVAAEKPDVVLITGGHRIAARTVRGIKGAGAKAVLWTTDAPCQFDPIIEAAPFYDHVFCQGSEAVEIFKKAGVAGARLLPMACDPEIHRPAERTPETPEARDVVFVGSYYPNRAETLSCLAEFNLEIRGPGWERLPKNHLLHPRARSGPVQPEVWRTLYSSSKIVVIIHFQDGKTSCYQASPKVFEALACRAFVLVDDQPDVFRLFENGKHLVKFTSMDELKRLVRFYLDRPAERDRLADDGYKAVRSGHTYLHRIRELLKAVAS